MKPEVKFCKECKYSKPDAQSAWTLKCLHPKVNKNDHWALGSTKLEGVSCTSERERGWFSPCGKRGKLFEYKVLIRV